MLQHHILFEIQNMLHERHRKVAGSTPARRVFERRLSSSGYDVRLLHNCATLNFLPSWDPLVGPTDARGPTPQLASAIFGPTFPPLSPPRCPQSQRPKPQPRPVDGHNGSLPGTCSHQHHLLGPNRLTTPCRWRRAAKGGAKRGPLPSLPSHIPSH